MLEKKRILIVDDDAEIRDLLEFDISSSGYFVDTASDGITISTTSSSQPMT